MPDFHQGGVVATLHRLDTTNPGRLEHELEAMCQRRPIGLVLPCLFAEFTRPALTVIVEELRHARYVDHIVVSLGQTRAEDLPQVHRTFDRVPQRVSFVWNDGPAVQAIYRALGDLGLDVSRDGKGRSCWIAYGYLLAEGRCSVIASHDADITTYCPELLARLCYPVAHPALGFEFAKGYYSRVNGSLNGRVTRLFVTPLVRAFQAVVGRLPFLEYLDSFRYPLAGEFAMRSDLAMVSRIPGNWGLEVGMLAEAYRHCGLTRICQTEVCANYDHKHQVLSAADPDRGLLRMSIDIAQTLLRALAAEGLIISEALVATLLARYVRAAEDGVGAYEADAAINCLAYDRHQEEAMVAAFASGLSRACRRHLDDPLAVPLFPAWNRVVSAMPDVFDLLRQAVEEDTALAAAA